MRYLPKSAAERQAMLAEIGRHSIDELFAPIPAGYRLARPLALPAAMAESQIVDYFRQRAAENITALDVMIGAGAYCHYRPAVIEAQLARAEWFTAYTPYQPEVAQGTLQAIFEFQTMICELTGQEVANASLYDGATAAAEAVRMAMRCSGRTSALVARSVHPEYREVLATYTRGQQLPVHEIAFTDSGRVSLAEVEAALTPDTACLLVQSPNFFGTLEELTPLAELCHRNGTLLIVAIAEALSLALVEPPTEADIVAVELQSFGVPLSFGGPYAGVLATREKFMRQLPGRLVGQTIDRHGQRGWVLTLATREQHIRREKATSNICTNQALVALMASIYLATYGKQGLRELAEQNLAKAVYARHRLTGQDAPFAADSPNGCPAVVGKEGKQEPQEARSVRAQPPAQLLFDTAPRFNEFVLTTATPPETLAARLRERKILGPLPLARWYPELGPASLWCATEMTPRAAIERATEEVTR